MMKLMRITLSLGNLNLWGAKPESGLFLFVCCQLAFRPPSGVCLCTSERIECCREAYALDAPALRFRGKEMNMNEEMDVPPRLGFVLSSANVSFEHLVKW